MKTFELQLSQLWDCILIGDRPFCSDSVCAFHSASTAECQSTFRRILHIFSGREMRCCANAMWSVQFTRELAVGRIRNFCTIFCALCVNVFCIAICRRIHFVWPMRFSTIFFFLFLFFCHFSFAAFHSVAKFFIITTTLTLFRISFLNRVLIFSTWFSLIRRVFVCVFCRQCWRLNKLFRFLNFLLPKLFRFHSFVTHSIENWEMNDVVWRRFLFSFCFYVSSSDETFSKTLWLKRIRIRSPSHRRWSNTELKFEKFSVQAICWWKTSIA